jgi:signal transduction histidine kinase/CheY-like chemotaxis protein/HPt (histidine-containing phosphotransfer) domain-containing protein
MRLQQRILLIILPLILVPILVLGIIAVSYTNNAKQQIERLQLDHAVSERAAELDKEVQRVTSALMFLAHNQDIHQALLSKTLTSKVDKSLSMFVSIYDDVEFVGLYDEEGNLLTSKSTGSADLPNTFMQAESLQDKKQIEWQILSSDSGNPYLQICYKMKFAKSSGLLKIVMKSVWLANLSLNATDGALFLISDLNGQVLFSFPAGELGSYIPNKLITELLDANASNVGTSVRIGAEDVYFYSKLVNENYLFIFGQSYSSLADSAESISWITGIIILISILCTVLLVYFSINRYVISPIMRLSTAKQKVAQGNLDVKLDSNTKDEFGELFASFNVMVRQLIVYREKERDSRLRLEYKVRERTEELEAINSRLESINKDIERARQESEQASSMKTAFVANMSHEIRTPLTAILGFTEQVIADGPHNKQQLDLLGRVLRSGKHLLALINNVLDMSKIEANKLQVEVEDVDLFELFNDVISLLSIQAADKELELSFNYSFPLPKKVRTDATRLRQILVNLASNAIKFTEQGYVHIDVRYNDVTWKVEVSVSDSGIGMSKEVVDAIFQPFMQADVSISRKFGGTGLGLVISKSLATMLGGDIQVKSELGKGSEFIFDFDIACDSEGFKPILIESMLDLAKDGDGTITFNTKNDKPKEEHHYNGRVLVAEDVEDNQYLLKLLLDTVGVEHDIVGNGQLAFEKAMTEDYALILMDMQMPIMGGLEATQLLRQAGVDTPIFALTANVMKEDLEKHNRAGCTGTIAKPIDKKSFINTVKQVLSQEEDEEEIDPEFEKSLLEMKLRYVAQLPEQMSLIEFYQESQNSKMLKTELHKIKGTAGSYGFTELSKLASELESRLKKNTLDLDWTEFNSKVAALLRTMENIVHAEESRGKES